MRTSSLRRLALFVALGIVSRAIAQTPDTTTRRSPGRIIGVYDERSGAPIADVEVRDMASGNSARTTETGTVSLFFVDTSGALIRLRKVGYASLTLFIENAPGLPPLTLTLDPVAQTLPAVVTKDSMTKWRSPSLRGFEQRRATGQGYFVPDSILRREETRTLANVIRSHVPSVDIVEMRDPNHLERIWVVMSRRTSPPCPVDVYLDGQPLGLGASPGTILSAMGTVTGRGGSSDLVNVNRYQVSDFAAVEYHNVGDVPAEYNRTGSGCGVLLLWTRER